MGGRGSAGGNSRGKAAGGRSIIAQERDRLSKETYDGRSYSELNDAQKQSIDEYLSDNKSWAAIMGEYQEKEAKEIYDKQRAKERRAKAESGHLRFYI